MLNTEVVVNLLPELAVGVALMRHLKDSSVARAVDQRWRGERAPRRSEGIPKSGTQALAVCATPNHLDYFVALALQQHGQQSALRKRKS